MPDVFEELDKILKHVDDKFANEEITHETYYNWIEELYRLYGVEEMN